MNNLRRVLTVAGLGAGMTLSAAFGSTIITTSGSSIIQTATVSAVDAVADATSTNVFDYFGFFGLTGQTLTGVTLKFTDANSIVDLSVTNTVGTSQFYSLSLTDVDKVHTTAGTGTALADIALLNAGLSGLMWNIGDVTGAGNGCDVLIGVGATQTWFTPTNVPTGISPVGTPGACTPTQTNPSGLLALTTGIQTGTTANYLQGGNFNLSYTTKISNNNDNAGVAGSGLVDDNTSLGVFTITYTYAPSGAPEPTTMFLLGSGLVGLGFLRRRAAKR
jgi:hypothetical protein